MRGLIGAFLWCAFLFLTVLLVNREEKRRLLEYRGLSLLSLHIKASLAASPKPLSDIFSAFEDEALRRAGFLTVLQKEGLAPALSAGLLHLDDEELFPFFSYAKALGTRLYAEERRAIEELSSAVSLTLKEKEAAQPRKEKLTGTLFLSGGMLVLLLLI